MRRLAVPARPSLKRRTLAAAAAAGLLAAVPTGADAAGWIPGPQFDVAASAGGIDFAAAPDASSTAAWVVVDPDEVSPDPPTVALQHAAADGALGPVLTLGAFGGGVPQIDVAAGASGASALAWTDATRTVQLTQLRADGSLVGTVAVASDLRQGAPSVAVDGAGDALVAWIGYDDDAGTDVAKVRRVTAAGGLGSVVELGPAALSPLALSLPIAVTPAGTGWVLWSNPGGDRIARVTAAGEVAGPSSVAAGGTTAFAALTANAGGAALGRLEVGASPGSARIGGVRLPLSGPVLGATFATGDFGFGGFPLVSARPALALDGTITVAWTSGDLMSPTGHGDVAYARFAPGAATASTQQLPSTGSRYGDVLPVVTSLAGGGALAVSLRVSSPAEILVQGTTIDAAGSAGATLPTGQSLLTLSGGSPVALDNMLLPFATADGGALLGVVNLLPSGPSPGPGLGSLTTRRLDATPPQLSASIPAGGVTGQPLAFSASVSDGSVWWDFGDDNGSRRAAVNHTYAFPGTYTVSVTATDAFGNATTQSRLLTIAAPTPPPAPPTPGARRGAAGLKLTSAVRSGRGVTIAGTIARSATGRVTLAYSQKHGRRTLGARTSARIAKGKFRVTLRLSRALAKRFKLAPTVTATYGGDSATDAAAVKRTVTIKRAARRAARRGGKKKR